MNQRSLIIAVVAVLVAVAAFLIWNGSRQPAPPAAATATLATQAGQTPATDATPTAATGEATATTAPMSGTPQPTGLSAALLTLADMPSNVWTERTEDTPTDSQSIAFLCQSIARRSGEVVRSAFQRTPYGPIVRSSVATYSAADAEAFMADLQAAVDNCTEWQTSEANGRQINWQATPIQIEGVGDQVIAVQAKTVGEVSFSQVTNSFAYIRIGNHIAAISTTTVNPFGGLADDHLQQFSRVMAERLQTVAQQQP